MKSLKHNFGLWLLLLIVAVALFMWLTKGCGSGGTRTVLAPDSTFYWKNEAGKATASQKEILANWEVSDQHWKDSIAKVYNSKTKFIKEILVMEQEKDEDLKPTGPTEVDYIPQTIIDCPAKVKNIRQAFKNKYDSAFVQIGDSSYLHYHGTDKITIVWKQVNEGNIFNRKKFLQVDVSNENPDVSITSIKTFRINQKPPKKWSIGLQAGYGFIYNDKTVKPGPYIGIGLSRSLIRF